jgi:hypothetical protein
LLTHIDRYLGWALEEILVQIQASICTSRELDVGVPMSPILKQKTVMGNNE